MYNQYIATSRGNLAIDNDENRLIWTTSERHDLSYRFATDMATGSLTDDQVRNAFREATRAWGQVANVQFREVAANSLFTVCTIDDEDSAYTAKAFFPHGIFAYDLKVNLYYVDNFYHTYERMVGLLTHELGHTLGLAHEHQRADSEDQQGQSTFGESYGAYDHESIMDYANRPYTSGISIGDRLTIQHLYAINSQVFVF